MAATENPVKLVRHRRIAWCVLVALYLIAVLGNFRFKDAGTIVFSLELLILFYALWLGYRIRSTEKFIKPNWQILLGNILNILLAGFVFLICRISMIMAVVAALVVVGVLLPRAVAASIGAFISARRGEREQYRRQLWQQRWVRFAIFAVAVSVGWWLAQQARENEKRDFDNIIAAVEQYKATEKRYPDNLDQLVPKYLVAVPTGRFMYSSPDQAEANLYYNSTLLPESQHYDFKSKKRIISD